MAASLAEIPDGPGKRQGIHYGERAAARLIDLRADDGRFAPVTFDDPPAPGLWRPTPPGFAPFSDPWMAKMRPLARVWSGIHFRTADVVGFDNGKQVGDWALDHYFQPTRKR